ncbi:hypothetical protein [Terrarubrum flagellatum]|uniref:hypothetical protein n=1 Tax=Terrirubrum flagellatum TaxID=2895980 RepID=UPI00314553F0
MAIHTVEEKIAITASELRRRYDMLRATTLIGQKMEKALFQGRAQDVLFWALVFSKFADEKLCDELRAAVLEALDLAD